MMAWLLTLSYFFTNELRLFAGLFLVSRVTGFQPRRAAMLLAGVGGVLVTALQTVSHSTIGPLAVELLVITAVSWYYLRDKLNLCLFLAFFYEVGVGLWDFLLQAGLGILFHSQSFLDPAALESLAGVWLTRALMMGGAVMLIRQSGQSGGAMRSLSVLVILGMVGAVTLSEQKVLPLDEDLVGTWIILSMVLMFAILFYRVNRQREMESEIARLKQEQAEIVERDYQALRRTYEGNAKLYHDLHNHIEAIYQCLLQGDTEEAARYCEDLRTPVREISQTVWTGDKALDYLISSKLALAEQEHIKTKVNIEYPHNTNIRSVDLTTILGNLLDNALEAAQAAPDGLRFLNLTIRRINAMLIIKVENGYGHDLKREDGKLLTTKSNRAFHGWGLKSVQTAADRYDGTISTDDRTAYFNRSLRCPSRRSKRNNLHLRCGGRPFGRPPLFRGQKPTVCGHSRRRASFGVCLHCKQEARKQAMRQEVIHMRHFYFRLILGIVFIGCMIFSFATMNIPFALLYIFLGGSFLYSAYSIWKKDKEDRG